MKNTRHILTSPLIKKLVGGIIAVCSLSLSAVAQNTETRQISIDELGDKIRGGWAGQMIGVSYGAPTEFAHLQTLVPESDLPVWKPEMIREALNQDDLYVDITFAEVLDRHGLDASTEDFGAMFRDTEYALWHANLAARRALRRGVPATLSGTPAVNMHANDIDFQIEADFIGLMSPGLPQASNELGFRAGRVMNHGDGILGGLFVSAMYATAFFEDDVGAIVAAGLAALPPESDYAKVILDLLAWHEQSPDDWIKVWHQVNDKWDRNEACPAGAMRPFNIDAKLNGAYVALGLLYGEGNFEKTMLVSTRAGQDSDCNPSSALGILGVVKGFNDLPEKYTSGIADIEDERFNYTSYSFIDIVESSVDRAIQLIERTGGSVSGNNITVKIQTPQPAKISTWNDYGSPKEQLFFDDERWQWQGEWEAVTKKYWRSDHTSYFSHDEGAEGRITFSGTGVAITGTFLPTGGQADVYLDGELSRTIDVYPDEPSAKTNETLWHEFGLEDKQHEVRIVVRGEPYEHSNGTDISVTSLLVFGN
jgi:hypothetical protein